MDEDVLELSPLFFDTICLPECGARSWENVYDIFEKEILKEAMIDDINPQTLLILRSHALFCIR